MVGLIPETESKLRELLKETAPNLPVVSVQVLPRPDSTGEPSLYLTVVLARAPRAADFEAVRLARRQLRDWLSDQKGDERYPYYSVVSEQEQREQLGAG